MICIVSKKHKIFDSIITCVFINMMNNFFFSQISSKFLFHDKSVLKNISSTCGKRVFLCKSKYISSASFFSKFYWFSSSIISNIGNAKVSCSTFFTTCFATFYSVLVYFEYRIAYWARFFSLRFPARMVFSTKKLFSVFSCTFVTACFPSEVFNLGRKGKEVVSAYFAGEFYHRLNYTMAVL